MSIIRYVACLSMKLTSTQIGMCALLGRMLPLGMPREWTVSQRIEYGREYLTRITRQNYGYDALAWHKYLWETNAGNYRWARRSEAKWARQVEAAIAREEWQQAVRELAGSA